MSMYCTVEFLVWALWLPNFTIPNDEWFLSTHLDRAVWSFLFSRWRNTGTRQRRKTPWLLLMWMRWVYVILPKFQYAYGRNYLSILLTTKWLGWIRERDPNPTENTNWAYIMHCGSKKFLHLYHMLFGFKPEFSLNPSTKKTSLT